MTPLPKPGDRVRCTEGTFYGFVGVVLELGVEAPIAVSASSTPFISVSLNIFGRDVPVLVDPSSLEPA